ncbi:MAG: aromatic amino acid ammonia-lyase [Cystobacterineae bacterium]|nr:aromatic amino acid ammonia-lyase [Cystobacterineae bacterium]
MNIVRLRAGALSISDVERLLDPGCQLVLDASSMKKVEECYHFLQRFARDKVIYGLNTGFGPMAQYRVKENEIQQLQYNLIRSHAAGTGKILPPIYVKATLIARMASLLRAHSGVHPSAIELLAELFNRDICPVIFEHGGVGASGDLVQLAHLALCLIGEGEAIYRGKTMPVSVVFEQEGLRPISIYMREGLALVNGTSTMTGIGMVNLLRGQRLLRWAIRASAAVCEIVGSFDDHFSEELNRLKPHKGQLHVATQMQRQTQGSRRIRRRCEHFYNGNCQNVFSDKVQDYYSIRCVPQILGPVYDTLQNAAEVLSTELNAVGDNPVVDPQSENIYHGGNFHGDYVAFEMDKLKIAVTKLAMLAERQLNYLMHDRINNLLPAFVNLGKPGLNYGMQAVQFTATSTTAECQTLANPMYIHSIPNNNDNQDIVSMGTNAANIARTVIENAFQVLAIELMAIVQAIDFLKIHEQLSENSQETYRQIRTLSPLFVEDTPKHLDIQKITSFLQENG